MEYDAAIQRLESFRLLELDWNGYNSLPVPDVCIDRCIEFVKLLREISTHVCIEHVCVFPSAAESVQVEFIIWHKEKIELEVEFKLDKVGILICRDLWNEIELEVDEFMAIATWIAKGWDYGK